MDIKEKYKLPNYIYVKIHKSKQGFTAVLPDYPGCMTYAENISELVENVNDALLTYLDVPRKDALKADFLYSPNPVKKQEKKIRIKEVLNKFVSITPHVSYA